MLIALAIAGLAGYLVYAHPPMVNVGRGELGVRANRVTGSVSQWRDGAVLDSLAVARQAADPAMLGAFQRWQAPAWKVGTLSIR